jgi:hypothetical protein
MRSPWVVRRLDGLCGAMSRHRKHTGVLSDAVGHFLKVTRSYPVPLPCRRRSAGYQQRVGRAGSYHSCQRRTIGRRAASAATVVCSSARLIACLVSRLEPLEATDLAGGDRTRWLALRADIKARRLQPTKGKRFRRDPKLSCATSRPNMLPQSEFCGSGFLSHLHL